MQEATKEMLAWEVLHVQNALEHQELLGKKGEKLDCMQNFSLYTFVSFLFFNSLKVLPVFKI